MKRNIGPIQIGIILLTLGTAIIHLYLGIPNNMTMFILNGIGYIVLLIALFLPQLGRYNNIVRWILIAYIAITIVAWVFIGARTNIGYLDKVIEIALIVLLIIDSRLKS